MIQTRRLADSKTQRLRLLMLFLAMLLVDKGFGQGICPDNYSINPAIDYSVQQVDLQGSGSFQAITLRLRATVVTRDDGSGGVPASIIRAAVDTLNSTFAANSTQINFFLDPCFEYLPNTDQYNDHDFTVFTVPSTADAIDIIVYPSTLNNNGGRADGIGIGSRINIGGLFPTTALPAIESNILAHEMGHVLGLLHTFQGTADWKRAQCCGFMPNPFVPETAPTALSSGDRILDTPADPSWSFTSCDQAVEYCENAHCDPTLNQDGSTYAPNSDNLMDYVPDDCLQAFTDGQTAVMRNSIMTLPHLTACIYSPPPPTIISGTVIIDTPIDYDADLIIPSGATLQVNPGGVLRFAPGTGIIVQSGGSLVSNGGVFTKLDCPSADSWKGIKVFADSDLSLTGGSTVAYAEVGVDNFHEFNSSLLPDIEINQATFTICSTAIYYHSTVGVTPTPSQLVLNAITIDQCGIGFTSTWAGGFKITNMLVSNCSVGVDIYNSRGVELVACSFNSCEEGVAFFNSDTPQLSDLTFTACADGVALDFVDGANLDDCSYQDITEIATHLYNSDAIITGSDYTNCTAGVVIDGTGFGIEPSTIGESGGGNFFLNVDEAVSLHGAMTSLRHNVQNNYFEDCFRSTFVNGLSTSLVQNNDIFYGDVGTAVVNTGNEDNLIQYNSISSVEESPSISVFTNDETRYLYNCYSGNPQRDIQVFLASVAENQWRSTGVASGNEFSKIDGVPSIDVNISQSFNYYVLDEHFVNPASVYYPNFAAGQTSPQGFDLQPVVLDEESDCGSGSNIQPPSSTCNCAKSSEENWAILAQLYGELTEVENNENLEVAVKAYQVRKLELCIGRIWRCLLWWDYDDKGLGDQGEDWVTDTDKVDIPSIRVLAVQLLLRRAAFSAATAYLATHTGGFGADGTDFETLVPLSIQQHTSDSLSTSDLLTIESIAVDSSTFSGLASAIYYKATGIRLIPQWGQSPEQRSIGANESTKVKRSLTLFPNPATDEVHIILDGLDLSQEYQIINQVGELMKEGTMNSDRISLEGLDKGLYVLRVGDNAKRFVKL